MQGSKIRRTCRHAVEAPVARPGLSPSRARRPLALLALFALVLSALALAAAPVFADEEAPSPRPRLDAHFETRVFTLQHISTKQAQTLMRAIFLTRQLFEDADQHKIVVHDDPEKLDRIAEILAEIDAPRRQRWDADIVLVTGSGERVVRRIDVEEETIELDMGTAGHGSVELVLKHANPGPTVLSTDYRVVIRLVTEDAPKDGRPSFRVEESGTATLRDGERLTLLEPATEPLRRALAQALGIDGEATALFVRVASSRAP